MNILDRDKYNPTQRTGFDHIPHYYGDSVRMLLVVAAAVWLATLPFFPKLLPFDPALQVLAGITVVVLAALTSPRGKTAMLGNVLFSGFGVAIVEVVAVYNFNIDSFAEFFIREVVVLLLLIALYLSLKTLRAMYMHQIGRPGNDFERFDN